MDAGRAAFERGQQGYRDATNYFVALVNDDRVPREIQAQAFFALGDTYRKAAEDGVVIATDPYGDAIIAFSRITNNFATNRQAASAMGRIGDCHLQRAGKNNDLKELELAAGAYQKAMTWPGAEAETRCLAEFALGDVRLKQGRAKEAAEHWSNILYPKSAPEAEALKTISAAGESLAKLREDQGEWAAAIQIYQRMQQMFPARRSVLQLRIDRARTLLNGAKK